ncbi:uncharacterized protein LOC108674425 [Hyalella azteca]|uniref:Uncharacterized protein LOC108674425 n=1 Tax=Hyalella azteca TaxID=294128 RepID=A0A8B7NVW3_HYAAZ|nr:uncharacterized protein LOC108674425 [Hyalella azteca]
MLQHQQEATPPAEQNMSSLDHSSVAGSPFHPTQAYNLPSNLNLDYDLSTVTVGGNGTGGSNSSSSIGSGVTVSSSLRDLNQHQITDAHQQHSQQQSLLTSSSHQQDSELSYSSVLPSLLPGSSSYGMTPLPDYTAAVAGLRQAQDAGIHNGSPGSLSSPNVLSENNNASSATAVVASDAVNGGGSGNNLIGE